jgi:hypothetical protein
VYSVGSAGAVLNPLDSLENQRDYFEAEIDQTNLVAHGSAASEVSAKPLAPAPYVAVCNATVTANRWDGEKSVTVCPNFSAPGLVAGTTLKPAG